MGKQSFLVLLIFSVLFLSFAGKASADGMIHISDPDMWPGWRLQSEDKQLAVINYDNGLESMLLAVDVKNLNASQVVWMFPVPARPEETNINIVSDFPRLVGYDIKEKIGSLMNSGFLLMTFSQIYPAPLVLLSMFGTGYAGGTLGGNEGVQIHEHIESMGLTTELVTAQDGSSLYSYLAGKGFELPQESRSIMDEYVGKEYSFVVSWISDVERFKQQNTVSSSFYKINTLGVYASFPSDRIYFPLRPTSVYGSQQIPIAIYVIGYVTPDLYPEIAPYTKTSYFIQDSYDVPSSLVTFFNGQSKINGLKYTKIDIEAPSSAFVQDLSMENRAPSWIEMRDSLSVYFWVWVIIFLALSSCLASLASGILVLGKYRIPKSKLAMLGLSNLLSILAFTAASHRILGKLVKPRRTSSKGTDLGGIIKLVSIAGGLLLLIVLASIYFRESFYALTYLGMVLLPLLFLVPFALLGLVVAWSYQKNEEITTFVFVFSLAFLFFVFVLKAVFALFLGL